MWCSLVNTKFTVSPAILPDLAWKRDSANNLYSKTCPVNKSEGVLHLKWQYTSLSFIVIQHLFALKAVVCPSRPKYSQKVKESTSVLDLSQSSMQCADDPCVLENES